jgi:hypothetical protein
MREIIQWIIQKEYPPLKGVPAVTVPCSLDNTAEDSAKASFGLSWPLVVAALAFILAIGRKLLSDPDIYWHLGAARWIFDHGAVPSADPFSHSMPNAPWLAHEWLAEVILGGIHGIGGWPGLAALTGLAFGTALALLCRYLLRHFEPAQALNLVVLAAVLAIPHLLARPHVLAWPLLVGWTIVLLGSRELGRAPRWPWALLIVVWANLHGSFVLGLGLAAFFAVEAVALTGTGQRRAAARDWGIFLALSASAALATPYGIDGLIYTFSVHDMAYAMEVIDEWRSPDFHQMQPLELGLMAAGLAILGRGLRLPAFRLVLVLVLLHLALRHVRHVAILGFLTALIAAEAMGAQWCNSRQQAASRLDWWFAALAAPARPGAILGVSALLLALFLGTAQTGHFRPVNERTPTAAITAALAAVPQGRVLNAYEFGGYLIYSGVPPFIDGRADMYGDPFLRRFMLAISASDPEQFDQLVKEYGIDWTIFPPGAPIVRLLDRHPGWRRLHADEVAVVHVRSEKP